MLNVSDSFLANKLELFGWAVSVVEEEFFATADISLCIDSNSMITIHHHYLKQYTTWRTGVAEINVRQ